MLYHLPFAKYHGAGNDFIVLNGAHLPRGLFAAERAATQTRIAALCDRHRGIGADGLIIIDPPTSSGADFAMRYFNSDGRPATMCGNGARCAFHFAYQAGSTATKGTFLTHAGPIRGTLIDAQSVQIAMPDVLPPQHDPISGGLLLNTGVPHLVIEVPPQELEAPALMQQAQRLRHQVNPQGGGANVNFYTLADDTLRLRTYERGVEAETLACGTGAVATALAAHSAHGIPAPIAIQARGGSLAVAFTPRPGGLGWTRIALTGPVARVADGLYPLNLCTEYSN